MARSRMIKPEFWTSKSLGKVTWAARLTFIGLWNFADDYGYHLYSIRRLLGDLYPYDEGVTSELLQLWIDELLSIGVIEAGEVDGQKILHITNWDEHQRVDHPSDRRWVKDEKIGQFRASVGSREGLARESRSKEKEKEKEKVKEKVKSISPDGDYLDQILVLFLHEYESAHGKPYLVVNRGKERRAVGVLLRAHRAEIKASGTSPPDSDETKRQFQALFRAAVRVNDPWLHNNMSPTILASKLNEILRKIENESGGKVQSKLDSSFFERLQRDGFIQGATGRS